jgi:subtilase-type serine protease
MKAPLFFLTLALGAAAQAATDDFAGGSQHGAAATLGMQAVTNVQGVLSDRMNGFDPFSFGSSGSNAQAPSGLWLSALAHTGSIQDSGDAIGSNTSGQGLVLGADRWFGGDTLMGMALATSATKADASHDAGKLTLDSHQLIAYARWQSLANVPGTYVQATLGLAQHQADNTRRIASLGQQAKASYDEHGQSLSVEAGHNLAAAQGLVTLTPYAGLGIVTIHREGFTETGSDADLRVQSHASDSVLARLGVRIAYAASSFRPTLDVAYGRELGDNYGIVDAADASTPGAVPFAADGPALDRNRLMLKASLAAWQGRNVRLDVGYAGEFASSDHSHGAAATLRVAW